MTRLGCLALALLLCACGGGRREAGPPEDEVLTGLATSATRALDLDQPESAARLYARALTRARERDDAAAIGDMAFGQATASLAHGDAAGALRVTQEVSAELSRRRAVVPPRLLLAEATALHRLGRVAEAGARAAEVTRRAPEDPAAGRRAQFLVGLIAAEAGDGTRLAAARAALADATEPAFRADALELAGREALLAGDPRTAAAQAAAAAALRRDALDYRGLSRALALEGVARRRLGEPVLAADLLRRAGQGAAERGEQADARRWLAEAEGAAPRAALSAENRRAAPNVATGRDARPLPASGGGAPRAQAATRPRGPAATPPRGRPAAVPRGQPAAVSRGQPAAVLRGQPATQPRSQPRSATRASPSTARSRYTAR